MLRRTPRKQEEPVKREPFTYIHRGTTVEGRVEAVGRVRVHGVVKGDVEVDGVVEVAPAGVIVGALVRAEELRILGKVRADVVVSGKVEIWNGGELIGDVRAAALDIEEGARFTGRSEMVGAGAEDGSEAADEPRDGAGERLLAGEDAAPGAVAVNPSGLSAPD